MKNLLTALVTLFGLATMNAAQAQYIYNREGNQFAAVDYSNIEGTPWLTDGWSHGVVKLADGKVYKDSILLKYNLLTDELFFRYTEKELLKFNQPVLEFAVTYTENEAAVTKIFRSGYQGVINTTSQSFFQVVGDGKLQLIKKATKSIVQNKTYNSAVVTKSFQDASSYFIVVAGKPIPIKTDKKSLLAAMPDHREQLKGYANAGKLNFKSDPDLTKLINYYNSL